MRNKYAIMMIAITLTFGGCVAEQDSTDSLAFQTPPAEKVQKPVKPLPDNYADITKPTWVPYYELPKEWEISPSSKTMMRRWEGRKEMALIRLELEEITDPNPEEARQNRLDKLTCVDDQSPYNNWLQCDRPIQKSSQLAAERPIPALRYWGTWMGTERQVDEYFFVNQEKVYRLTLEGGLEEDWIVVKRIIETLELRHEIFTPQVEDEELGG